MTTTSSSTINCTSVHIDPRIKIRKSDELIDLPKTILVNKFDEESAKKFRDEFAEAVNTGQPVIPIIIDSYGGQIYSLLSMVDVIKSSSIPVSTIVTGKAMSCGSLLFSCGQEGMRYITPMSAVLIHDVSSWAHGKV